MKFTEEHFNKLVWLQEKYFSNNVLDPATGGGNLRGTIRSNDQGLYNFIIYRDLENQAVALMNPATREWAHEQFVEKEKKSVWNSKKTDSSGHCMRLFRDRSLVVRGFMSDRADEATYDEKLTESEIREWGYDPERFDQEEVK